MSRKYERFNHTKFEFTPVKTEFNNQKVRVKYIDPSQEIAQAKKYIEQTCNKLTEIGYVDKADEIRKNSKF